jgi:formylglycine-generating enzyme
MKKRRWGAWAAALSTTAVGCASLIGIDNDYVPVGDDGAGGVGGTSGAGDGGHTGGAGGAGLSCKQGDKRCQGSTPQSCDDKGAWQSGAACAADKELCVAGVCAALPPSCADLPRTCGLKGDESCCAITVVPGGMYNRSNDPLAAATVSDFRLDRFEITVGRFRKFVEAYPMNSKPKPEAGAHPKNPGSGWSAAWDMNLPPDQVKLREALFQCEPQGNPQCFPTWTNQAGTNENKPINSITWFEAFAFCAWDGGRLPTEAEWNYATAGGDEQRPYPWGDLVPDGALVAYDCIEDGSASQQCAATDILPVGSKPMGDGRFGQADLAGSIFEWNLDKYLNTYPPACTDCTCLNCQCNDCSTPGTYQVIRGGSWASTAPYLLSSNRATNNFNSNRLFGSPGRRFDYVGARCARDL